MNTSILYETDAPSTIYIIDVPRSIELSQGPDFHHRIISTQALKTPFPSLEPKSSKARSNLAEASVNDLVTQKILELSLAHVKKEFKGEWCLPRTIEKPVATEHSSNQERKRRSVSEDGNRSKRSKTRIEEVMMTSKPTEEVDESRLISDASLQSESLAVVDSLSPELSLKRTPSEVDDASPSYISHSINGNKIRNESQTTRILLSSRGSIQAFIPPRSTLLSGYVEATRKEFTENAPQFDFIIMDPPWPNRSARRKAGYGIAYNTSEIRALLTSLPLEDHIAEEGVIAVWITNKAIFRELAVDLFSQWGVSLVEEWTWLKVTDHGEPIYPLNSLWRKPYEILLVARKGVVAQEVERRVMIGVPDLHSRKPSVVLLQHIIQRDKDCGHFMEVFARNLSSGWWSWGNEVFKFQETEHWVEDKPANIDRQIEIKT